MVYSFQLIQHANIRYREAVSRLGRCELLYLLHALGVDSPVVSEKLGGAEFLTFEAPELSDDALRALRSHSSVVFMARRGGDALYPLTVPSVSWLAEDLPEVLKYKGKTSVPFTQMMINVALSLTPFFGQADPVTVLDPMCGKATSLFCALQHGMNGIGIDLDSKDVKEACDYFSRYLKYHGLKHTMKAASETIGGRPVPVTVFTFSNDNDAFRAGDTRTLKLSTADASAAAGLTRKARAHILTADLPYGIQHAPQNGRKPEPFTETLSRVLPAWYEALLPGGAIALSFNTLTLPSAKAAALVADAGFTVCPDDRLRHEVEQAVVRDVVFACKPRA